MVFLVEYKYQEDTEEKRKGWLEKAFQPPLLPLYGFCFGERCTNLF
jgi:hypothetical protein